MTACLKNKLFWLRSSVQREPIASGYYSDRVFSGVASDRRESRSDGLHDRSCSSARRSRAALNTPSNKIMQRPSNVTMTRQRHSSWHRKSDQWALSYRHAEDPQSYSASCAGPAPQHKCHRSWAWVAGAEAARSRPAAQVFDTARTSRFLGLLSTQPASGVNVGSTSDLCRSSLKMRERGHLCDLRKPRRWR